MLCLKIFFFLWLSSVVGSSDDRKLLIVAFDGLRYDFVTDTKMPFLTAIAKEGVWATKGMKSLMTTRTMPNFNAINTGLFQENSGIVGNFMHDPTHEKENQMIQFVGKHIEKGPVLKSQWFDAGTPIWTLNEESGPGRFSGCMRWPLCDVVYKNRSASYMQKFGTYAGKDQWVQYFDTMLTWLQNPEKPVNLGLFYVSEPDHTEHANDIYGPIVQSKVTDVDKLIRHIMIRLEQYGLKNQTDLILLSDHGHTNVHKHSNTLDLDQFIDPQWYFNSGDSIFPKNGVNISLLYEQFQRLRNQRPIFNLWCKNKTEIPNCEHEIPKRFHYKNHVRIGPILLQPYLGYYVYQSSIWPLDYKSPIFGAHGHSPEYQEMWPFFVAIGPSFKKAHKIDEPFLNVDVYELMAHLLRLKTPPNDGTFDRISDALSGSSQLHFKAICLVVLALLYMYN